MDNQHKLGLPFEYQQMPEYFDAHNVSAETEVKNALIEKLLKEHKDHCAKAQIGAEGNFFNSLLCDCHPGKADECAGN